MRCAHCGAELRPGEQQCSNCCQTETAVQVLTPEEKRQFQGVTLEQEGETETGSCYKDGNSQSDRRIYVRQINLTGTGLLTKLFFGAILAVLIFIVLPITLFFAFAGIVIWLLLRRI